MEPKGIDVPARILIESITEFVVADFRVENHGFPELLKILEKRGRKVVERFDGFPNCGRIFDFSQVLIATAEIPKF